MTTLTVVLFCGSAFLLGATLSTTYWGTRLSKLSSVLFDLAWFEKHGTRAQRYNDGHWTLWSGEHFSSSKNILEAAHNVRNAVEKS